MYPDKIEFRPIGTIHSPHTELSKIPVQPVFCTDIEGTVVLDEAYLAGLEGIEKFSHLYLFFWFHESKRTALRLKPYLSDEEQGIFATRAPYRPNKLGMSVVRLVKVEGNVLHVKDVDILDGTPLLDIKPYVKRFDVRDDVTSGWQDTVSDENASRRGKRDYDGGS